MLPSETLLADANVALAGELGRERRLRLAMQRVDAGYDFVVFDTSPQRSASAASIMRPVRQRSIALALPTLRVRRWK